MAATLSPKPSDGPLNAQANSVTVTVSSGHSGTVYGILKLPGGARIEVPITTFFPGSTRVVIPLPRGGVPPGTQLRLLVTESTTQTTFATYTFR